MNYDKLTYILAVVMLSVLAVEAAVHITERLHQQRALDGFTHIQGQGTVVCLKIEKPGRCAVWLDKERFDLVLERFKMENPDGE